MSDAKSAASMYILTLLLQRLEKTSPGLIQDMIQGVKADQAGITNEIDKTEKLTSVFHEALTTLENADRLLRCQQE